MPRASACYTFTTWTTLAVRERRHDCPVMRTKSSAQEPQDRCDGAAESGHKGEPKVEGMGIYIYIHTYIEA